MKHSQCQETPDGSTVGRSCTKAKIPREQQQQRERERAREREIRMWRKSEGNKNSSIVPARALAQ